MNDTPGDPGPPAAATGRQRPAVIADLAPCDTVIDARSPSEFAIDHVPGAINCPVLSDDERRIVGTLYKQQGAFEARRVGGAMVAANLAAHLRDAFVDKPREWKPVVYCWRGGLRSAAMVQWLRLVGWDARQLDGGYKTWRRHVIATIESRAPLLPFRVVCGPTGSAKTRVLQALAALGEQVLDLEACASHKGSVLGTMPGLTQPSQKQFETRVAQAIIGFDASRPVYVESESRKIGRIALPTPLLDRLRASPCIAIAASTDARLAYLLSDYAYLGDDREALAMKLALLHGLQSNETLARWQEWARGGELAPLFSELMTLHYDPLYARSQHGNFPQLRDARRVEAERLDDAGIEALARNIIR